VTGFEKQTLETFCFDAGDGKMLWRQSAPSEKIEPVFQRLGSPATPTPATDGTNVCVYFGSYGLLCYDREGQEQWRKPLAAPVVEFGAGVSPIFAGGLLILNCDQDVGSCLLALNPRTGQVVWKTDRSQFRRGFATPFVWRHDGIEELVVPGSIWLKSYDLKHGTERWTVSGTSRVACSSPAAGDGLQWSEQVVVFGEFDGVEVGGQRPVGNLRDATHSVAGRQGEFRNSRLTAIRE
jgi:outer membrane protein assembly factor BamB